ncbi:odontogenic ameloblast-associated protein [Monodelphis domestica]|uniref:odontogenic ameloblast-associated protein n=1 Tax=Monodelphis domestica TaxID=13616 RepID=UPI0024E1CDF6|nr:odontogenic ameloblast-associated protein [Monodelphis domestica]
MRAAILLGFLGVALAAPLLPQPLLSASNSREASANPLIFPLPGALHHGPRPLGLSWPSLGHFGGLVPNEVPLPGQARLAQRSQAVQQEAPRLQMLQQNQQDPYQPERTVRMHRLLTGACLMSPKQMVPYYPVCVYGAQDPPLQLSALAGPPQPPEQVPSYPELGCLTQQAQPPIENVLPYTQREMVNLGYPYAGIFMPSYPLKHQTANILASPTDNVVPLELLEEEINPDLLKEP